MFRILALLMVTFILYSCRLNTSNKAERSLKLFKEGSTLMQAGFKLEVQSSDSSSAYYRQAIDKFLLSYQTDTSNLELAIYLPDLYFKIGKNDSALYWKSKIKPIDSFHKPKRY